MTSSGRLQNAAVGTLEEKARICRSWLKGWALDWIENWQARDPKATVVNHYPSLCTALLQGFQEEMTSVECTE